MVLRGDWDTRPRTEFEPLAVATTNKRGKEVVMSGSRVKKQRHKSGVKFTKAPKVPTPIGERHEMRETVLQPKGLRGAGLMVPRSETQLKKVRKKYRLV